jgi:hypothetical protein
MNPTKQRVLVSGLLVLCLCVLLPDDGLSLTQLVAASGAWACAVWLWKWTDAGTALLIAWWKRVVIGAVLLFICAALRHHVFDRMPVEKMAKRYGITYGEAYSLSTYLEKSSQREKEINYLDSMGKDAAAYISSWRERCVAARSYEGTRL